MELTKLLCSEHPEKIREVYETGISTYVSPAFAALDWQNARVSAALPKEKYVRWAAFLRCGNSPETAVRVLRDLKLDNETLPEKYMPLRILGYDGASYRSQLQKKRKRPVAVLTIVLYFGTDKMWDKPCI